MQLSESIPHTIWSMAKNEINSHRLNLSDSVVAESREVFSWLLYQISQSSRREKIVSANSFALDKERPSRTDQQRVLAVLIRLTNLLFAATRLLRNRC